ncbi:astacin-like metalloendopeptidase [Megalops cyprinoides]|uniref:astacin-like metalloendopeptidase n=1 Tax=Megalops cyprinoides TaxID=118141 RepID=UPI001864F9D8|nr:astacin-like metalloendopeptidase [Megalops cyprinoides]
MEVATVEGDILLRENKNAAKNVWKSKDGRVSMFYTINKRLANRKNDILAAMNMISQKACISFHKRTVEKDYLHFRPGHGCASYVGFWGGAQPIYVARKCHMGNIAHELMHALGFNHEHVRTDRDAYITVLYENVIEGRKNNFSKRKGDTMGLQYDTESIMHYGERFFSRNGKPTIITKNGQAIGQRTHLTKLDVQRVRKLYKCALVPPEVPIKMRPKACEDLNHRV